MPKGLVRGSLLLFAGLVSALLPLAAVSPLPTVASAAQPSDPAMGPHTRDEAQHRYDVLSLTPAHTGIAPRRSSAARPYALAPAAGVVREVFGFAPYWRLAPNPNLNYALLSTVAYFGININPGGRMSTNDA